MRARAFKHLVWFGLLGSVDSGREGMESFERFAYLFPLFFIVEGGRSQMSVMRTRRKDNG